MDDTTETIPSVQQALKLMDEVGEEEKEKGLVLLEEVLKKDKQTIIAFGYDHVILKELIKFTQFEKGTVLHRTLGILENHYFSSFKHLDELAETLIYRIARSTEREVCHNCLESLSTLVDNFDDSIAKHSKQIFNLSDLNAMTELNPLFIDILTKLGSKLPQRKRKL